MIRSISDALPVTSNTTRSSPVRLCPNAPAPPAGPRSAQRIGPHRPGRSLTEPQWLELWADLAVLMRAGVRANRIITTRPADRPRGSRGPVRREDSFYVYRRAGLPCRLCAEPVRIELLAGRNLYWCATEQPD
jgi:endonuclease-8